MLAQKAHAARQRPALRKNAAIFFLLTGHPFPSSKNRYQLKGTLARAF